MYLYDITFKYLDALNEDWKTSYLVAYNPETAKGKELETALETASKDGDYKKVTDVLTDLEVTDEDVCFYFDITNCGDELTRWTELVPSAQQSFNILIKDITYLTGEDDGGIL